MLVDRRSINDKHAIKCTKSLYKDSSFIILHNVSHCTSGVLRSRDILDSLVTDVLKSLIKWWSRGKVYFPLCPRGTQ